MTSYDVYKDGELSPVAIGCEQLGGVDWGSVDLPLARESIRCALDNGVTVFDTADVYGLGRSEEELAKVLGDDRHRVTIVTKGGVRWGQTDTAGRANTFRDASPKYLMTALEGSLKRLQLETIPVYLVHWPDSLTPVEETLEFLERARIAGKIRSYGLSNFDFGLVRDIVTTYNISYLEGPYSLLDRFPLENNYREACRLGLKTLTYGPLAQGVLTGKYSENSKFAKSDRRHRLSHFMPSAWPRNNNVIKVLRKIADELGRTPAQVALRWVIESKVSGSVIVGAKTPQQVRGNIDVLGWALSEEQRCILDACSARA
jgi:aryl-alcohol dehydrogenase-like predicted oxidoreductase